jgi:MtaA/CmuA family methyltransferase
MDELTQLDRLLYALFRKKVDRVPVASFTQTGTVELMKAVGAYWPKANRNADEMAALGMAAHTLAGLEAVRIPFGLIAEAEALGCKIDYHEGKIDFPPTCMRPLDSLNAIEPDQVTGQSMDAIIQATEIIKNQIHDVPVIVGVTGPFTVTGMIHGIDQTIKDLVLAPQAVSSAMEISTGVIAHYCQTLTEAGADIIVLIEPTASVIGPVFFKKFLLPNIKKIVRQSKIPAALHVCGNSIPIIDLMVETGVAGISIDQKVSISNAKKIAGLKASVIGNLDPVKVLLTKKPLEVERECKRILEEGVDILAPGCGLSPQTPLDNIRAMVKAGKKYKTLM